jgi:RNase P subunit RPR2
MVERRVEEWMGFACKKCGTPLAVERSSDASASGDLSPRGWRVACTACGETEYYEPRTPMVRIAISTGSRN